MGNFEQITENTQVYLIRTDIKTNRVYNIRENEKIYIGELL